MSTIQKNSGGLLIIKRPGARNSYLKLRTYFQNGFLFSPHPAVPVSMEQKRHGYGRATANRYYEYLFKFKHAANKKSRATKSYVTDK
jgi:Fic family protein